MGHFGLFPLIFPHIDMINRALTRLKTLQVFYAHTQDENRRLSTSIKMLNESLDQGYELYMHLLSLLTDIRYYAERRADSIEARAQRLHTPLEEVPADARLAQNKLLLVLEENEAIQTFKRHRRELWPVGDTFLKRLTDLFTQSETFLNYIIKGNYSFEADADIVRELYKQLLCDNDDLAEVLEENSIFWNDDRTVVDSFVLKTLRRFKADSAPEMPLLPQYDEGEGPEFGEQLLSAAVKLGPELRELISAHVKGWEFERVALMDLLIMQQALAEILTFPDIPLNVTFSEYISIAKCYSTSKSGLYVNGVLDAVVKVLKAEGKIYK